MIGHQNSQPDIFMSSQKESNCHGKRNNLKAERKFQKLILIRFQSTDDVLKINSLIVIKLPHKCNQQFNLNSPTQLATSSLILTVQTTKKYAQQL